MPQDSKPLDVIAIHHQDRVPDTTDDLQNLFLNLEDQDKTSRTYSVNAQFGLKLSKMFSHLLTVNATAELSFIDETFLTAETHSIPQSERPHSAVLL